MSVAVSIAAAPPALHLVHIDCLRRVADAVLDNQSIRIKTNMATAVETLYFLRSTTPLPCTACIIEITQGKCISTTKIHPSSTWASIQLTYRRLPRVISLKHPDPIVTIRYSNQVV
ncbi:hypothetical protein Y032_0080g1341 [Ancylostoma ceylanicum]|uniref:Uncharacterized protein n=1 Tax=Ancylostoma ceylanicum TaxID=53326 RepID=A0A016TSI3_9BILA|nr:hypothetical protein Y032_0080g1341 [Ancylostoma ceylanicum]